MKKIIFSLVAAAVLAAGCEKQTVAEAPVNFVGMLL